MRDRGKPTTLLGMIPSLVLLAAGMSTRYGRLKQLEPLGPGGEALLDYAVFDAHRAGFDRVVLIIREELEGAFRAHVEGRWPEKLEVVFHHQRLDDLPGVDVGGIGSRGLAALLETRRKPWGTAHAVLTARPRLSGPFALVNADDFYGEKAFRQAMDFLGALVDHASDPIPTFGLITYTLRDTLSESGGVSRGICRLDGEGWLEGIREVLEIRRDVQGIGGRTLGGQAVTLSGAEPISTNFWLFDAAVFPLLERGFGAFLEGALAAPAFQQPEFLIPTLVNQALEEGSIRVRGMPTGARFLGITHPADREGVVRGLAKMAEAGHYPPFLWSG